MKIFRSNSAVSLSNWWKHMWIHTCCTSIWCRRLLLGRIQNQIGWTWLWCPSMEADLKDARYFWMVIASSIPGACSKVFAARQFVEEVRARRFNFPHHCDWKRLSLTQAIEVIFSSCWPLMVVSYYHVVSLPGCPETNPLRLHVSRSIGRSFGRSATFGWLGQAKTCGTV